MSNLRKYGLIMVLFVVVLFLFSRCAAKTNPFEDTFSEKPPEYGVFIGADPEHSDRFEEYDVLVIDAAYYEEADLEKLHQSGKIVYSYLNIGSIEDFRETSDAYEHLILGRYENWPGEFWVDVSDSDWQDYIRKQADLLIEKGIDGFFIDNADVYFQYHTPDIFRGLVDILNDLEKYKKDIFINGGDIFVTEAIVDTDAPTVRITGVNQECVFSNIDFETENFIRQSSENTEYYQAYLEKCHQAGLEIYLLEYSVESDLIREIEEYCNAFQFGWYVSSSLDLQ